jgi:hypothetical protein
MGLSGAGPEELQADPAQKAAAATAMVALVG